mmetsp:Transcript_29161/g.67113  ORF Transcript_29161/g.67113 Transcript_29161/m.67113 type:complete len:574 (-) Transcript_29161:145-1866(-)
MGQNIGSAAQRCASQCSRDDLNNAENPSEADFEIAGQEPGTVSVLTWNVAAVNNNPFEYWISMADPLYMNLMVGVEKMLSDPGENDKKVNDVFTEDMFRDLKTLLMSNDISGMEEVEEKMWRGGDLHLRDRRIISDFVKDPSLGAKRLISMPDRVTNTINVVTKKASVFKPPPVCRPAVINNYDRDLGTLEDWWEAWKAFMFRDPLVIRTRSGSVSARPVEMLEPIPRSKYPSITEDEERLAYPLQILCLAIFDAIMVFMMNYLSPDGGWMNVKKRIMDSLYKQKAARQLAILEGVYAGIDVYCLQEVAATFHDSFESSALAETHTFVLPQHLDGKRDQNSIVVLRKGVFEVESVIEVTDQVVAHFPQKYKLADGDLLAITFTGAGKLAAEDGTERNYMVVSFHGDTDGLLTGPVLQAVDEVVRDEFPGHILLLGFDANLYIEEKGAKITLPKFMQTAKQLGYTSCFGDDPDPKQCRTTCNARTFLQPQLNKAIRYEDRVQHGDSNPKDIILFKSWQLQIVADSSHSALNPMKDNTGKLEYLEDTIFPSLEFPSDHAVVAALLKMKPKDFTIV